MLGFWLEDHWLRAIVIFHIIGGILSYMRQRWWERRRVRRNQEVNESIRTQQYARISDYKKPGEYGWEQVFNCIGAFFISWFWLIAVAVNLLFTWLGKCKPANWM